MSFELDTTRRAPGLPARAARFARRVVQRLFVRDRAAKRRELALLRDRADVVTSQRDQFREQRDAARAQRDRLKQVVSGLTSGDLYFYPVQTLAQSCAVCGEHARSVSAYPYSLSPQFSRLIVLWCAGCGFGWVPEVPFDLSAYYRREYAATNRRDRDIAPELYFSQDNPVWKQPTGRRYMARATAQLELARSLVGRVETMLDFGSGPGYALNLSGAKVKHAVEYDDACRPFLEYLGARIVSPEQLSTGYYDLVLSSHSLEHLQAHELADTMKRLAASVRAGGILYVEVPTGALSRYVIENKHEPHTSFFTPESLARLVESAGLEICHAETRSEATHPVRDEPLYVPSGAGSFETSSCGAITVVGRKTAEE